MARQEQTIKQITKEITFPELKTTQMCDVRVGTTSQSAIGDQRIGLTKKTLRLSDVRCCNCDWIASQTSDGKLRL